MNPKNETPRWPNAAGTYPGCSDGGCAWGHPGGMHANGGCKCLSSMTDPHERIKTRTSIRALLSVIAAKEPTK